MSNDTEKQKENSFNKNLSGKAVINGEKTEILIPYSEIEKFFNWHEEKQNSLQQKNKFDKDNLIVRKAVGIALEYGSFSTSIIQAKLGKGHGFVSALALWLEENEVIGVMNNHYPRKMLIGSMEEFDKKFE